MPPDPVVNLCSSAAVGPQSARLWFRVAEKGDYVVRLSTRLGARVAELGLDAGRSFGDGTHVVAYPQDVRGAAPLSPLTWYRYSLSYPDGRGTLLEGQFETAPSTRSALEEPFAIALMSCHQPLSDDGSVDSRSVRMLDALPDVLRRERVKRVLMLGDQMYTDLPAECSLFDESYFRWVAPPGRKNVLECSADEVRNLLSTRYRRSWGVSQFDAIQREFPCHLIPDDHEFVDNFGSLPEHSRPEWSAFRQGAIAACHNYEMARLFDSPEPPFHFSFEYGPVAVFAFDLRTEKQTRDDITTMFGPKQLAAFARFLERQREAAVIMIALSVPIFHLPDWAGALGTKLLPEGGDLHDRWSAPAARGARDALLYVLKAHRRAHPDQLMLLVGGDVHVSLATRFVWADVPGSIYQLTASPLSNNSGALTQSIAGLMPKLKTQLAQEATDGLADISLLEGVDGHVTNPLAELNVGIVSFEPTASSLKTTLKLYTFDPDRHARGKLVYQSPALMAPLPARPTQSVRAMRHAEPDTRPSSTGS